MRILHILDHSVPLHSGYTFRTAAILGEQRKLGWETFHLTSPKHTASSDAEETVDGLHFFRTPWKPAGIATKPIVHELGLMRVLQARIEEVVRRVRPQILHAHSPVLNAIPAIRVGRRLNLPVVYEVRAFWEDAAVDHGTASDRGLRYRATRVLETWALKNADAVTCICEGLRSDIVARGISAQKVTVIPNAVDVANFRFCEPADAELRAKLGIEGRTVIGFIGSFYAYEGLDLLVEALPLVMRQLPEVRLLLVGGGPQEAPLKERVAALGLEKAVLFTGRVPHADVHRYYALVDVFAYPRQCIRLTELVTPLKPLEAMAQGRLLVASDVGGHRELIRNGETGILFPAGNVQGLAQAILHMLDLQPRWPELRAAGRRFIEKERTWSISVANYRAPYGLLARSSV